MTSQEELNAKLRYHFEGYVVNKGSNRQDIKRVPKFVAEHLLTKISEESEPMIFNEKLMKVIEIVNTLYPEPKDKDRILDKIIIKKLSHKIIIDEIKVEIDEKHEIRKVVTPSLNLRNVMISDEVVEKNEQLLSTGIWGLASLRYCYPIVDSKGKPITLPVIIESFESFHGAKCGFERIHRKEGIFYLEEWINVLNTVDLNPEVYTEKQKLILIKQFIPLVENNVNLDPELLEKHIFIETFHSIQE